MNNVPDSLLDPLCITCKFRNWIEQNKGCMPHCRWANKAVCNGKFKHIPIITECERFKKDKVKYRQLTLL